MIVLKEPQDSKHEFGRSKLAERRYVFDIAFDELSSQEEVYMQTTKKLVSTVMKGYNATVFAYGATGAGKTFTMVGTDDQPGIMVRALNDLFRQVELDVGGVSYHISMSYLEIYNESIRDLLNPSSGLLDIREDSAGVVVAGLSEVTTTSTEEVLRLLMRGNRSRTVEPTAANKTSSRSHALLQVTVRQSSRQVAAPPQQTNCGRLFMVDLAGSERASQTQNRGKRLQEGAHINKSLLALGNCINALAEGKGRYVNFRDSKLTRLLKNALCGNCKTVMIAHVSPSSSHFDESRNTLAYADRAKSIRNKIIQQVNVQRAELPPDITYHHISQYQNIIENLQQEITRLHDKLQGHSHKCTQGRTSQAEQEIKRLREKLMDTFQEQMILRHRLIEIDSHLLKLSLHLEKHSLVVKEWEAEKAKRKKIKPPPKKKDNKEKDKHSEKKGEAAGSQEPDDVRHAYNEINEQSSEQRRYLEMRGAVERQLEIATLRAATLEEEIPMRLNTEEQREMLHLLCKVHELEVEKTEMQADTLLKEHELFQKDDLINRYDQQRELCDTIIQKQRQVIEEQKFECPTDLQTLYTQYQHERQDMAITKDVHSRTTNNILKQLILKLPYGGLGDSNKQKEELTLMKSRLLDERPVMGSGNKETLTEAQPCHSRSKLPESERNEEPVEEQERSSESKPRPQRSDSADSVTSTSWKDTSEMRAGLRTINLVASQRRRLSLRAAEQQEARNEESKESDVLDYRLPTPLVRGLSPTDDIGLGHSSRAFVTARALSKMRPSS